MPAKKSGGSGQKKKKVLSNNRGFATVSIPKKKEALDETDNAITESAETPINANGNDKGLQDPESNVLPSEQNQVVGADPAVDEWDEADMQRHELQMLAEKVRPASDKEIARTVKVMEYDRRLAKSYAKYAWQEQDLVRRVLAAARAEDVDNKPLLSNDSEDKVLTKLVIIYGVLERLECPKELIELCIKSVKTLDLECALDWLSVHGEIGDLICRESVAKPFSQKNASEPSTITSTPPSTTETPSIARDTGSSSVDSIPSPVADHGRSSPPPAPQTPSEAASREEMVLRARILAYDDEKSQRNGEHSEEEVEDGFQDANMKYSNLKLKMSELTKAHGVEKKMAQRISKKTQQKPESTARETELAEQIEVFERQLKEVENNYTFRRVDAEKLYREQRLKLDSARLVERLNGLSTNGSHDPVLMEEVANVETDGLPEENSARELTNAEDSSWSPKYNDNTLSAEEGSSKDDSQLGNVTHAPDIMDHNLSSHQSRSSSPPPAKTSLFTSVKSDTLRAPENDQECSELFGNLLEEMPSSEVHEGANTIVSIRNMALPKHFSGKTPKAGLEEVVRRLDKYATVLYKVESRSRAVRASLTIHWDGGKINHFEMKDVACYDQAQAYNYVATLALFTVGEKSASKQLPVAFRELWDELLEAKKDSDEAAYREELKYFRSLAEKRNISALGRDTKNPKSSNHVVSKDDREESGLLEPKQISEALMQEFAMRQEWPPYQAMLQHRATLPISSYRSFIMSTIEQNQCMVLCGETGCGKSTQVPSFILEHDMRRGRPVKIFCTEPRRISAISLAQRVSAELGEARGSFGTINSLVGYSIRLDSMVSANTRIIYATTGIVLRMLEGPGSLADCTHIIIDEVHERSIDSDFLLIVLKEILERRKDLKVILMSATVDAEKIAAYMGGCPVIQVPGRTFPVTAHYLEDVVELTGYRLDSSSDSPYVAKKMRTYGRGAPPQVVDDDLPSDEDERDDTINAGSGSGKPAKILSRQTLTTLECLDHNAINFDIITLLLESICFKRQELVPFSAAILIFLPSLESIRKLTDLLESHRSFGTREFLILPLHSTLSNENQGLVFDLPPPGIRKIVISTNIAETGVTIPDITCVIDTGKHREMRYDEKRQISRLVETFVAQSNVAQRRGRAGRVREGVAFHLFTKDRHDLSMPEHPQPEILRLSLQDLALRIKIMKIGNSAIEEVLAKALDPPLAVNVQRAIASLIEARALTTTEEITPLGRHLAKFPLDVGLGKFLIMACLFSCLDAALTIAATLNSKSPWLTPFGREAQADAVKRSFKVYDSDFLTTYNAYCSWRQASGNGYEREFTKKSFLSQQNLQQIEELRQQYFSFLVDAGFIKATLAEKRELISTRYGKSRTRFVAVPAELDMYSKDSKAVMSCLAASLYPKIVLIDQQNGQLKTLANSAPAAIHPSSVNFTPGRRVNFEGAKFVAYFTAMHTKKLYVWESGTVDERAIYLLCGNADIQLTAQSLVIDRKIKVQLEADALMAVKLLRNRFQSCFMAKMKDPMVTTDEQSLWLGLIKEALVADLSHGEAESKRRIRAEKAVVTVTSITRNADV